MGYSKNQEGASGFIGFLNYYRQLIRDFSKIACPLHPLTGNEPFVSQNLDRVRAKHLKQGPSVVKALKSNCLAGEMILEPSHSRKDSMSLRMILLEGKSSRTTMTILLPGTQEIGRAHV